jgi:ATP-binding cassette subfamily B (MDR/TAP) protein 1
MIEAFFGLLIGTIISFIFSWQMALISLGSAPFVLVGGVLMGRETSKNITKAGAVDQNAGDAYQDANALLSDVIMNYRTVISLGEKNIKFLMGNFSKLLEGPNKEGIKQAHISGVLFGYS